MTFSASGKTVFRGGWGRFYYHSGQFTSGLDASAGVASASLSPTNWVGGAGCPTNPTDGAPLFAVNLSCLNLSSTPSSPAAVDKNDDKQPYTDSWSATVDQTTPWQGLLEMAYVGNRSRDLQNTFGGAGSNINLVPAGAMFSATNPGNANANNYRPLQGYGDLNLATNNLYSNYNALQVAWARHAGLYTIQTNYTWQKALGIVVPTLNPFDLHANYGILPSDRRNLFNIAYSIDLGNRVHVNAFVNGALNGWQFSGITQAQSGANITYGGNYNPNNPVNTNYNMSLSCVPTAAETAAGITCAQSAAIIPGSKSATNPKGHPDQQSIDPGNQRGAIQSACDVQSKRRQMDRMYTRTPVASRRPPRPGQNGPTLLPVSYGPAFVNSDMAVFKNFNMTEKRNCNSACRLTTSSTTRYTRSQAAVI